MTSLDEHMTLPMNPWNARLLLNLRKCEVNASNDIQLCVAPWLDRVSTARFERRTHLVKEGLVRSS
jgi:hypothetical protein